MYKNIYKSILAAALVALVITSCTDEADVLDNTPIKNKKTLTQPTIERPYPGYEESDMSSSEAIQLVSRFDKAMKGDTTISSIDITNAVSALETFFNYGVVAKQEIVDTTTYYTGSTFQFEVNIDGQGNINGAELVDAYTTFLNNFLQQMNGKYLQFSDLFVKAVGNGKVMFGLEIPTFTVYDRIVWEPHKCKVLNSPDGPFDIPLGATINWTYQYNTYGTYVDQARLSELCSTYEDGFMCNIETQLYGYFDTYKFAQSALGDPFIVTRDDMIDYYLPNAIIKSWELNPSNPYNSNNNIKIVDLLFSNLFFKIGDALNAYSYVTKKRHGIYVDNPYWLSLDNILFVGI
ncbi:MAG: hypothetical protein H6Q15_839 [Bacteroidetes bacterium]|nr:hypothetical protein [Bacteroidota bacterium]